jgi:hypothetical protein
MQRNINVQISLNHLIILLLTFVSLFFTLNVKPLKASTQTTFSGSCGIIFTTNINGWDGVAKNYAGQVTNNAIGTINFDTSTFKFNFSDVTPYGNTTHVDEVFYSMSGKLSLVSFDTDSGVYTYTATDSTNSSNVNHINILPVNSGNTFLVTAYSSSSGSSTSPVASGVCQKV